MLISTIEQLRAAAPISVSNNIGTFLPFIEDAEETFVIPVLGQLCYDALDDYIHESGSGSSPGDPALDGLLLKVRKAIALYALYYSIDELGVNISSAGIREVQSDDLKSAPQYKVMNVKENFLSRAHRQIDLVLKYISQNSESLPTITLPKNPYFIRNADEFQLFADIHGSRRVFLSLMPVIGSIEQKYIKPTLSPGQFDDLKTAFQSGTSLSADNQSLLDLIIPALVHLTMARALLEISIDTLDWGIFNNASNTFNNIQNKVQVNERRVSAMHDANQRDGEAELKMLQEFMDNSASADKYALYFTSSRFVGKENAAKRGDFVNSLSNTIFIA